MNDAAARPDKTIATPGMPTTPRVGESPPNFEKLVSDHGERVKRLCCRLSGWNSDVDDIVQETFLAAFKGWPRFRGDSDPATWLTRIAVNCCRRQGRKRWPRLRNVIELQESDASDVAPSSERELMDRERFKRVRSRIRELPLKYREAVVLRYLEELSVRDAADVLGLSINAMEVRLNRARKRLRTGLAEIMNG